MSSLIKKLQMKAEQLTRIVQREQEYKYAQLYQQNETEPSRQEDVEKSDFDLQVEMFREKARILRQAQEQKTGETAETEAAAVEMPEEETADQAIPSLESEVILEIEDYDAEDAVSDVQEEQKDSCPEAAPEDNTLTENTPAEADMAEMDPDDEADDDMYPMERPLYVSDPEQYAKITSAIAEVLEEVKGEAQLMTDLQQEHMQQLSDEMKKLRSGIRKQSRILDQQSQLAEAFKTELKAELTEAVTAAVRDRAEDNHEVLEGQDRILSAVEEGNSKSEQVAASLEELKQKQETNTGDLAEKIHSENVKAYRNTQELFKENSKKQDEIEAEIEKVGTQGKLIKASIGIGVLNLLGVAALLLLYFHVI